MSAEHGGNPSNGPDRLDQPQGPEDRSANRRESPDQRLQTRTGMAWVSIGAAAFLAVALIVFMAQNTQKVHISFLWMDTSTSLALTLLIASVTATLTTLVIGTARIVQLRRVVRRQQR